MWDKDLSNKIICIYSTASKTVKIMVIIPNPIVAKRVLCVIN